MVTIIIPTYNASKYLPCLMAKLKAQTFEDYELIIIDSSSTDDTVAIARASNAKVIIIPKTEFDHGGTRTLAAKQAKGEILIFLTQDVLPYDDSTVKMLIKPLIDNSEIAAVFGRQIAYPDASLFAQHLRMFNYPRTSYVRIFADSQKYGLKAIFFSNSFSAYRKSALQEIGYFREGLIFGEDTCAAADILLKGREIAYAAEAKVFHSHNYTVCQDFRRYFDMGVFHKNEKWLLTQFGRAEGYGLKYIKSEFAFINKQKRFDLFPEFVLRTLAKYLGYKLGRQYLHLPCPVNRRFSMHRLWWNQPRKKTLYEN